MTLNEKYGEYVYRHYRPAGAAIYRTEYAEYADRSKAMQAWCNEQKFDHWGMVSGNNDLFWFNREEDYLLFCLRWA
jgi:hypothetical protein